MNRDDTTATPPSVLVVDDDLYLLAAIKQTLTLNGYAATTCDNPQDVIDRLGDQPFAAVLADIRMPEMNGMVLLERIIERDPDLPVILITGHGDISLAVEAVKKGAYHFLQKPVDEDIILATLERAIERRQLVLENRRLEEQLTRTRETRSRFYGLVGSHPSMLELYRLIETIAHEPDPVLIIGETGTGKELVARAIHDCGFRRSQAFIVQNCASLPENLLESELFGYRKGAFTGADRDRKGLFDAADGGTLFLDEIGDMPLPLQAKLLRVLQEGEVRPLGSTQTHKVDVRIIAATHRDLRALVEEGRFREDLFYRLSHFPIELPPLRARAEDILQLARHFATEAACFLQRDDYRWSEAALDHLAGYAFPGNVRELKGLIARAVLLCEGGELLPEHFNLQPTSQVEDSGMNLRERLEQVERNLLLDCLRKNRGNQSQAARELGLPRRTLLYRMDRLNISPADV